MKPTTIHIIAVFILSIIQNFNVNAQLNNDSTGKHFNVQQTKYTQYLKKSHDQKVIGTVLAIGGSSMLLTGVALGLSGLSHLFGPGASHPDYGSAPDILIIGGGALCVGSVILLVSSRKNKRLANVYMQKETLKIAPGKPLVQLASLGIKIKLQRSR